MRSLGLAIVMLVGCAAPRAPVDAPVADAFSISIEAGLDAPGASDAGLAVDAVAVHDAGTDANVRTRCTLADGHACTRWVRTGPHGDDACLGYDGLGVICSNDPSGGTCDAGSGHSCSRWVRTDPHGDWACLGYDGFGTICSNDPSSGTCDVGSGHSCARWVRTEPHGDWACLGYDGLGSICE